MWGAWGHAEVSILGGRLPSEMRFQRPKVPRRVCGNCSVHGIREWLNNGNSGQGVSMEGSCTLVIGRMSPQHPKVMAALLCHIGSHQLLFRALI